jgi:hypothetical protein
MDKIELSKRLRPDVECAPWVIAEVQALEAENAALKARGPVLSEDETRALLTAQSACSIAASSYDPRSDKRRQFIDAEAAIRNLLERAKR